MSEQKRDWNKIVADSANALIFLPSGFTKAAEEWLELRSKYNALVKEMAQKEITLNMALQNLFFEVRKYLAKNGRDDIWVKDVGFESNALDDGKFVINIIEPGGNRGPR